MRPILRTGLVRATSRTMAARRLGLVGKTAGARARGPPRSLLLGRVFLLGRRGFLLGVFLRLAGVRLGGLALGHALVGGATALGLAGVLSGAALVAGLAAALVGACVLARARVLLDCR